jgi:hypothetical protein
LVEHVSPRKAQFAIVALCAALSACDRTPPVGSSELSESEAGYVAPPVAVDAEWSARGVALSGEAPAGSDVRLATPAGQALDTRADAQGRWRFALPPSADARIFGLSTEAGGRRVQAQGYLLVGPRGQTAVLRAGAAAIRLDHAAGSRISALDFDGEGGALLSGWAPEGTDVAVRLDGRQVGEARADAAGRFAMALPRLRAGPHRIDATGAAFTDVLMLDATPAPSLVGGPLHSQLTTRSLRADWLTPGGGVQSTILAG